MIYGFSLQPVGFVVGTLLVAAHAFALAKPEAAKAFLIVLPRSRPAGLILLWLAAAWAFWLVVTMDMGEFSNWRKPILGFLPVAAILASRYVDEFLAARALGMLVLLAAEPLLEAAFLRPEQTRLLLVVLAYAWALLGMFWVGMPFLLRDQIKWVAARHARWRVAAIAGVVYGVAILGCAFGWG